MRKKTEMRPCIGCIDQIVTRLFVSGIGLCPALPVVAFLVAAFLAVSCTDDIRSSGGDEQTDAVIRLTINAATPQSASTRSVNEDKIHNLHVLVYNSSGELTGKSYSTFDESESVYTVTVNARSGDGCKIYAIANTNNTNSSTLFDGTVANTEEKLKAIATSSTAWGDLNNSSATTTYLPMCGSTTVNISAGSTTLDGGMKVKRLVAKVRLNVGIASGSGVTISGYRIYGVPKKSYYVAHPLTTEEQTTDTQPTRAEDACLPANASNWTDSGLISLSEVTSFNASFYMYENRPGVNADITLQKNKIKAKVPGTPADSAAYVMIYGKATGYSSLSWKVYLGANNTSNFNVKRNCQYTCNITLKPNDSDTRISYKKSGTIWAGSNIYWDGTKLTFDTETSDANNKKQGVCFRWGSLVGVSLSSNYVTYTPTYNSDNPTESSWVSAAGTYSDFSSVAYISVASSDYGQTNTFLNDAAQNTDANYAVYKGDICQYLSKTGAVSGSWRMPTAKKYNSEGLADNASVSWSTATTWAYFGSFGNQISKVNAQGTFALPGGGTYTVNGSSSSFPASGYRVTNGTLSNVGQTGRYWSSSAISNSTGYYLYFGSSNVYPADDYHRQGGFAVRCIQN
ncbi:MAG: DUF4906 domain-containing protein [Bacteroides sp.]|nr:DUF4906 domain-containing protein [Bacteroides sp.]